MEVFGLQVNVELLVTNLERTANQIRNRLKNVKVDPKTADSFKGVGAELSRSANRIAGQLNGTLGQVVGSFSGIKMGKPAKKKGEGEEGEETGGGIMGMLGSTGGKAGIVGAAVTAGVVILKGIHDKIQKMIETLKETSPAFKSMKDTTEKIWNLAMKPMGDFLATLMRPYILLAMQVLRPQLKQMYATIKAAGGKITPEVTAQLQGIFQNTMASLGSIFQNMMALVQPFAAQMDGFLSAIGVVFNNWLTGMGDWINGLVQGIGTAFSGMPEALANTFLEAAKKGEDAFNKLPENMHAQFFDWVVRNPSSFPQLAGDVRNEMFGWLVNTPSELPKLSGDVATAFKTWLTTGEGADDLAGLPKNVADKVKKWLSDEAAQKQFTDAINTAATTLGTALGTAGTEVKTTWDTFTNALKKTLDDVITNVKNVVTNQPPKTDNWFASLITTPIKNAVDFAKAAYKTVAPVLGLPTHQAGTPFVPETGPAILHRGEAVLPTREAAAYRAGTNKSVMINPTITINSNVRQEIDGDAIARRMARQTELNMRSLGLI